MSDLEGLRASRTSQMLVGPLLWLALKFPPTEILVGYWHWRKMLREVHGSASAFHHLTEEQQAESFLAARCRVELSRFRYGLTRELDRGPFLDLLS